jgi:hypothetical protein
MILLDLANFGDGAGRYSRQQQIRKSDILVRFAVYLRLLMGFLLLSFLPLMDVSGATLQLTLLAGIFARLLSCAI